MSGRFGGDYDQYDDEELDDDDLDNLEDDDEEFDEDDAEELEEEIEEEIKQEKAKKKRADNRAIENRLKKIRATAPYRFHPHFTIRERVFLNKARKTHSRQVASIERLMRRRQEVFRIKTASAGSSLPLVLIFGLILILIIFAIAIVGSILSFLFGDGSADNNTASSQFGVNGEDFYGTRVVYTDAEKAQIEIIENYLDILNEKGRKEKFNKDNLMAMIDWLEY